MTVSFVFTLIFKVTRLHGHAYRILFAFNLIPFRTGRNSILTLYCKISFHSNKMNQEHVYCISIFFLNIIQFLIILRDTKNWNIFFIKGNEKYLYKWYIILNISFLCLFLSCSLFHIYTQFDFSLMQYLFYFY